MIRHICPTCGAKLKASVELAGREGRCPTCFGVVSIPDAPDPRELPAPIVPRSELGALALPDEDAAALPTPVGDAVPETAGLGLKAPELLGQHNHYLICSGKDVIATWENDGKGWMVRVKDGFVRAASIPGQYPTMGQFVLVEIAIEIEGPHKRLAAVHAFNLPNAVALARLAKSEHAILAALESTAELSDRQKAMVRQRINAKFLPTIWDDAEGVL